MIALPAAGVTQASGNLGGAEASPARMHPLAFWSCAALFIVAATYAESFASPFGSGFAGLVQALAALFLYLLLLLVRPIHMRGTDLLIIVGVVGTFLIGNLTSFGFFPIIGAINITVGLLLAASARSLRADLLALLRVFLVFHMAGLAAAILIYVLSGEIVDLHRLLLPWSESRAGVQFGQPRLTGFHIEPGNYANAIYLVVMARALLRGRLANRTDALAMVSTLATFSAWAFAAILFWTLGLLLELFRDGSARRRQFIVILGAVAVLVVALGAATFAFLGDLGAVQYVLLRFSSDDANVSTLLRAITFEAWLSGVGSGWIFPQSLASSFCDYCVSPHGIGFGFNVIYYFGIPLSLAVLLFWAFNMWRWWSFGMLIASIPMMGAKSFYYEFLIWLTFGLALAPWMRRSGLRNENPASLVCASN